MIVLPWLCVSLLELVGSAEMLVYRRLLKPEPCLPPYAVAKETGVCDYALTRPGRSAGDTVWTTGCSGRALRRPRDERPAHELSCVARGMPRQRILDLDGPNL